MKLAAVPAAQKKLIRILFGKIRHGGLKVRYWDDSEEVYGDAAPTATLIFRRCPPPDLNFADPLTALGEAYMDRVLDYEGRLEDILPLFSANRPLFAKARRLGKMFRAVRDLADRAWEKQNIRHHYDLGNDFFSLWLDETMSYSCAYFKRPDDPLPQAQRQKIDHTLKKLSLRPGERLLDIGCGWGWLIIRAAQAYGASAVGLTLSEEQYKAVRQQIADLGLAGKVTVGLASYRDLDAARHRFDKIVSVGMFEHVGKADTEIP